MCSTICCSNISCTYLYILFLISNNMTYLHHVPEMKHSS
uniref:Uncharacterized protein n=1 Tax=Anguilla anguilla TaxID=7936 RepID=A0A0E9TE40_ANGAN